MTSLYLCWRRYSKRVPQHKTLGWGNPILFILPDHLHMVDTSFSRTLLVLQTTFSFLLCKPLSKTKLSPVKYGHFNLSMTADAAIRIDLTLQSLHTFPTRSASSSCGHHPRISTMPWQKLGHSLSPIRLSMGSYPMEYVPPRHRGSSPHFERDSTATSRDP